MAWTNRNSSSSAGGGGAISFSQGAILTPAAGVITVTDPLHHVAAGTISSIVTTAFDAGTPHLLMLVANGALVFTAGTNLVMNNQDLDSGDAILFLVEGAKCTEIGVVANQVYTTTYSPTRAASAGTWTGGTPVANYAINGRMMRINFSVTSSTLNNTPTSLTITLPAGYTTAALWTSVCGRATTNGTAWFPALIFSTAAGASVISISLDVNQSAFAANSTCGVAFTIEFEVQQ